MSTTPAAPFEPFDAGQINLLMSPVARERLKRLTVLQEVDSTNSALQRLSAHEQHAHVVLAERQSRGRGRRQKSWHSPSGCNIYLSLGWCFPAGDLELSTLPLATAICTCRALSRIGMRDHGIKWPNDILAGGSKLAGILLEMQTTAGGPSHVVLGVGINVDMQQENETRKAADAAIERKWTDVKSHLGDDREDFSRNGLVALLLEELLAGVAEYAISGFNSFAAEWDKLDLLKGQPIKLLHQGASSAGIARGISEDGGLLLEQIAADGHQKNRVFHAGEVSVQNA